MKIIGITGKAGSGKDTALSSIIEFLKINNKSYKVLRYSDPLKRLAIFLQYLTHDLDSVNFSDEKMNLWNSQNFKNSLFPNKILREEFTGREFLIEISKALINHFNEDIWANLMDDSLNKISGDYDYIIISDCRLYVQCYLPLIKYKGYLFHITGRTISSYYKIKNEITETDFQRFIDNFKHHDRIIEIDNSGSLDKLETVIFKQLEKIENEN